jgi:hypothetical protein
MMLKDRETGDMRISGLRVPKNGTVVNLKVTGPLSTLNNTDEQLLFGFGSFSASMGRLSVEVVL